MRVTGYMLAGHARITAIDAEGRNFSRLSGRTGLHTDRLLPLRRRGQGSASCRWCYLPGDDALVPASLSGGDEDLPDMAGLSHAPRQQVRGSSALG
jgi:hypothetical protein